MIDVQFCVKETQSDHRAVCIVGSHPQLGAWNPQQGIIVFGNFQGQHIQISEPIQILNALSSDKIEYKLVKCHFNGTIRQNIEWEQGENRVLDVANQNAINIHRKQFLANEITLKILVEEKGFGIRSHNYPRIQVQATPIIRQQPIQSRQPIHQKIQLPEEFLTNQFSEEQFELFQSNMSPTKSNSQHIRKQEVKVDPIQFNNIQRNQQRSESPELVPTLTYSPEQSAIKRDKKMFKQKDNISEDLALQRKNQNESTLSMNLQAMSKLPQNFDNIDGKPTPYLPFQSRSAIYEGNVTDRQDGRQLDFSADMSQALQRNSIQPQRFKHEKFHSQVVGEAQNIQNNQRIKQRQHQGDLGIEDPNATAIFQTEESLSAYKELIKGFNRDSLGDDGLKLPQLYAYNSVPEEIEHEETENPFNQTNEQEENRQNIQKKQEYIENSEPIVIDMQTSPSYDQPQSFASPYNKQISLQAIEEEEAKKQISKQTAMRFADKSSEMTNSKVHQDQSVQLQVPLFKQIKIMDQTEFLKNSGVSTDSKLTREGPAEGYAGIILESLTGPQCQIEEIDDYQQASVGLLKDAVCHCLGLPDWVQRHHVQLFFSGYALVDEEQILSHIDIAPGAKINYIILIA